MIGLVAVMWNSALFNEKGAVTRKEEKWASGPSIRRQVKAYEGINDVKGVAERLSEIHHNQAGLDDYL